MNGSQPNKIVVIETLEFTRADAEKNAHVLFVTEGRNNDALLHICAEEPSIFVCPDCFFKNGCKHKNGFKERG